MHLRLRLPFVLAALALPSLGQGPVKIDLNPAVDGTGSNPRGFGVLSTDAAVPGFPAGPMVATGGWTYFTAETLAAGRELWRTDGTAAGTAQVLDLRPGSGGAFAEGAGALGYQLGAPLGDRLLFVADDGIHGAELWSTQGAAASTALVADLVPGSGDPQLVDLAADGTRCFLVGQDAGGAALWVTDGTGGGTAQVFGPAVGTTASGISNLVVAGDGRGAFFTAANTTTPGWPPVLDLWWTDGTAAGTQLLLQDTGQVESSTWFAGRLYFGGRSAVHGWEPHVSDGTPGGTGLLADLAPGPESSSPRFVAEGALGGELYFQARRPGEGAELWVTDGTPAGTTLVSDLVAGPLGSEPVPLGVAGGRLILAAGSASSTAPAPFDVGNELYALDRNGPVLLGDFGASTTYHGPFEPSGFPTMPVQLQDKVAVLVRPVDAEYTGWHLLVTDGTVAGTELLDALQVGSDTMDLDHVGSLTADGQGGLLFAGHGSSIGSELLRTDGTAAGTGLVADLEPHVTPIGSAPRLLGVAGTEDVFLRGGSGAVVGQLVTWSIDEGLQTLTSGAGEGGIVTSGGLSTSWFDGEQVVTVQGVASPGPRAVAEPFVTDGTLAGTAPLLDLPQGATFAMLLGTLDGTAFFWVEGPHGRPGLWALDGPGGVPRELAELSPVPYEGVDRRPVVFRGKLVFIGVDPAGHQELWSSDGSRAGTSRVVDLKPGASDDVSLLWVLEDALVFLARDGSHGLEPHATDGTATVLLADTVPGPMGALGPVHLGELGGVLYLHNGADTWATRGTPSTTHVVPGGPEVTLAAPQLAEGAGVRLGSELLLAANDVTHGRELWAFDGQTSRLVADLEPAGSSAPYGFVSTGGPVYFLASTAATGHEVWRTDGTAAGTHLAFDLQPGPGSGALGIDGLLQVAGGLVFAGDDGVEVEPWFYPLPHAQVLELPHGGSGASLTATAPTLGSVLTLTVEDAPTGSLGVLACGAPTSTPHGNLLAPGSGSWLDPLAFTVLAASTAPTFTHVQAIPNQPFLAGAQVNVQAWFLPPALLPATTSNGLRLVLGS